LDPFTETEFHPPALIATLARLTHLSRWKVSPVYVLSPDQLELSVDFSSPWAKAYLPAAQRALVQFLDTARAKWGFGPGVEKGRVILQPKASQRASILRLVAEAAAKKSTFILSASHRRKGVDRFVLGSFAETLIHHARSPLLLVSGDKGGQDPKSVLFATDFGKGSHEALLRLANVIVACAGDSPAGARPRIHVFHAIPRPIEPVIQAGVYLLASGWVPAPVFLEKEEARLRKSMTGWESKARKLLAKVPVELEFHVDSGSSGVVDATLRAADRHHAAWIAVQSRKGPVGTALIGSITRELARRSELPLWVDRG